MAKGCVIFDFDGVIADTESLHHTAFNRTFAAHETELGKRVQITPASYFGRYIVYGDREGISHMLRDNGIEPTDALVAKLSEAKDQIFRDGLHNVAEPLPGVQQLLAWLEENNVPRAICSGGRRGEIEMLLNAFQLRHHFDVMVTIEDVRFGKPEPEGYNKAFDLLNLEYDAELDKDFSLVIEDSAGGCTAGKEAGIRVLGVATSLSLDEVRRHATFCVQDLSQLDLNTLAGWLGINR